jgi:hypothetical protein
MVLEQKAQKAPFVPGKCGTVRDVMCADLDNIDIHSWGDPDWTCDSGCGIQHASCGWGFGLRGYFSLCPMEVGI